MGAGDAFLAALLLTMDRQEGPTRALTHAVAAGTAVLLSTGDVLVTGDAVDEVLGWVEVEAL